MVEDIFYEPTQGRENTGTAVVFNDSFLPALERAASRIDRNAALQARLAEQNRQRTMQEALKAADYSAKDAFVWRDKQEKLMQDLDQATRDYLKTQDQQQLGRASNIRSQLQTLDAAAASARKDYDKEFAALNKPYYNKSAFKEAFLGALLDPTTGELQDPTAATTALEAAKSNPKLVNLDQGIVHNVNQMRQGQVSQVQDANGQFRTTTTYSPFVVKGPDGRPVLDANGQPLLKVQDAAIGLVQGDPLLAAAAKPKADELGLTVPEYLSRRIMELMPVKQTESIRQKPAPRKTGSGSASSQPLTYTLQPASNFPLQAGFLMESEITDPNRKQALLGAPQTVDISGGFILQKNKIDKEEKPYTIGGRVFTPARGRLIVDNKLNEDATQGVIEKIQLAANLGGVSTDPRQAKAQVEQAQRLLGRRLGPNVWLNTGEANALAKNGLAGLVRYRPVVIGQREVGAFSSSKSFGTDSYREGGGAKSNKSIAFVALLEDNLAQVASNSRVDQQLLMASIEAQARAKLQRLLRLAPQGAAPAQAPAPRPAAQPQAAPQKRTSQQSLDLLKGIQVPD